MKILSVILFNLILSIQVQAQGETQVEEPLTKVDATFGFKGYNPNGTSSFDLADVYATWEIVENRLWFDADVRFNFYTRKAIDTQAIGGNRFIVGVGYPVYANESRTEMVGLFLTGGFLMDQGIDYSYAESTLLDPDKLKTHRPIISPRIVFFNRENRLDLRYGYIFIQGKNAHMLETQLIHDWGKFVSKVNFKGFHNAQTGDHFYDVLGGTQVKLFDDSFRAGLQTGVMQNQFYAGFTIVGNWFKVKTQ